MVFKVERITLVKYSKNLAIIEGNPWSNYSIKHPKFDFQVSEFITIMLDSCRIIVKSLSQSTKGLSYIS